MHEIVSHLLEDVSIDKVKCIKGFERIQAEYSVYLTDESKISSQPIDLLYFPKNENELAAVIREMSRKSIPLTVAGARTGLVGGSVPMKGTLVSLELLDAVECIFWNPLSEEWIVRAQTAVSLKSLDSMLRSKKFPSVESNQAEFTQSELQKFKDDPASYFYPPDPTEMSASLGGSVVTNASGARTYRFGPTRAWVRGIRVLLASGEYLDIPRGKYFASPAGRFIVYDSKGSSSSFMIPNYSMPRTKSTSGIFTAPQMDLIDLFIGSEGVFGIVTRVDIALMKREDKISIVQFVDSDEQAIELTIALRQNPLLQLDFLEFYSENALNLLRERQLREPSTVGMPLLPEYAKSAVFFEMSFNPRSDKVELSILEKTIQECGASIEKSWVGYESRELDRFKVFRHLIPETVNDIIAERKKSYPGLHKLGTDLAVPDEHLREMWQLYRDGCTANKLDWLAFGHIGNNHLHINILPRNMEDQEKGLQMYATFAKKAVEFGGAVSAEHGVGKIKTKFFRLMFSEEQIDQMKQVKNALDPQGILNPGDIFGN
ncbi:MAG: FAD-binding oxidoreductase [Anaerolineaceae bacterium]